MGTRWFFLICVMLGLVGVGAVVGNQVIANGTPALPDAVAKGHAVWQSMNCESCHTLYGQGGAFAPDLTHNVAQRGEAYLREFMLNPASFHPNQRVMPRFSLRQDEISAVIAYLTWAGEHDVAQGVPLVRVAGMGTLGGGLVSADSPSDSTQDPALDNGRKLFSQRCASCHSLEKDVIIIGPSLWNIKTTGATRVSGESATDYIRNSVLNPSDYVVEGFQDVMAKNLGDILTTTDLDNVVAFLLSLGE